MYRAASVLLLALVVSMVSGHARLSSPTPWNNSPSTARHVASHSVYRLLFMTIFKSGEKKAKTKLGRKKKFQIHVNCP